MSDIPVMTVKSSSIVAKPMKLKTGWDLEGKLTTGIGFEEYYYEIVSVGKDINRYYARDSLLGKYTKKYTKEVMKWLRKKLSDPKYVILKEGSNFFDVILTDKMRDNVLGIKNVYEY